ncbi:ester cyclase [Halobacteriales archaeon Cl-PHB]
MAQGDTEPEEVVKTAFERTLVAGDIDAVAECFSSDVDYYRSSGELAGRSGLVDDIAMFHQAFPDLEGEMTRLISEGEKVSFLYTLEGTHEGQFEGIPPTHKSMEAKGAAIMRVEDGMVTEYRLVFDNLGMLEQLGVVGE